MTFSIKHLLFAVLVIAAGIASLANAGTLFVSYGFDLLTLAILIATAYGIWLSQGEVRAFRIGFLSWAVLYCVAVKWPFDIGASYLIDRVALLFRRDPTTEADLFGSWRYVDWRSSFHSIADCLVALTFGLIGGWVTVYFYRKRQRMLNKQPSR